jgi:hypothetical protein
MIVREYNSSRNFWELINERKRSDLDSQGLQSAARQRFNKARGLSKGPSTKDADYLLRPGNDLTNPVHQDHPADRMNLVKGCSHSRMSQEASHKMAWLMSERKIARPQNPHAPHKAVTGIHSDDSRRLLNPVPSLSGLRRPTVYIWVKMQSVV